MTLWVALGIVFHLGVYAYLLLGIPITAAFQRLVRRQPLRALWVREAPPFRPDASYWAIAVALAICPSVRLAQGLRSRPERLAYDMAAIAGAFAAAYALRNFHRETIRPLLLCLAIAGGIGILIMVANAMKAGFAHRSLMQRWQTGVGDFLILLPITMVLEEVSFRGAFDAHLHHPGEAKGLATAFYVSALWGLWHLPVVLGLAPLLMAVPSLLIVHCVIGVPLSIYWRRSGNLLVTGSAHALIDAVRNALLVLPWH